MGKFLGGLIIILGLIQLASYYFGIVLGPMTQIGIGVVLIGSGLTEFFTRRPRL